MLRPYQKECVDAIWNNFDRNVVASMPTGCHTAGTKVLLYNGRIKNVEDVLLNEILMGNDSKPRYIKNLCRGSGVCYDVIPIKGEKFTVNEDHILSLISTNEGKKYKCNTIGKEIVNISVKDYLLKSKSWKHLYKLYSVPVTFKKQKQKLPFPPYFLGLYLGDGCSRHYCFNICTPDKEIVKYIYSFAKKYKAKVSIHTKTNNKANSYNISLRDGKFNIFRKRLASLGLCNLKSGDRFIPHRYKVESKENRLEILAGILDTDGSLSHNSFDYLSKSETLAEDVAFVARSIGLCARVSSCIKGCQNNFSAKYYRVSISGDCSIIPNKVKRKQSGVRKQKKRSNVTGFKLKYIGIKKYYGFNLTGNNLYLLKDFTVTHNSGKSFVIAELCKRAVTIAPKVKICILAHVKELLEQNQEKLHTLFPEAISSLYCAGLKQKEISQITIGSIQSIYKKSEEIGAFDFIIVDEAHRIPHGSDGMYHTFFNDQKNINPKIKIVGLTATPYRATQGLLHKGDDALFDDLVYEAKTKDLIDLGYLSLVVSKQGSEQADLTGVGSRAGDFILNQMSEAFNVDTITNAAVADVIMLAQKRHSIMVFCCTIEHVHEVYSEFKQYDNRTGFLTGLTNAKEREDVIHDFKSGKIRILVNCDVLTTGFDAPNIDCIVLLRATKSPGLYVQIVGRGLRIHESKQNCLLLDYGENVQRHGPLDDITVDTVQKDKKKVLTRVCPECKTILKLHIAICPECNYVFPKQKREVSHNTKAGDADPFGNVIKVYDVLDVKYYKHIKPEKKPSLRVEYICKDGILRQIYSEWICFEHSGFPKQKAQLWAARRGVFPPPKTIDDAVNIDFIKPRKIAVNLSPKYPEIINYEW